MIGIDGAVEFGKLYASNTDRKDYLRSPIYGKIKGLADITLFVGTREIILSDARRFKAITKEQGIDIEYHEYSGMNYVLPVFPIPETKQARKTIVEPIKA